MMRIKIFIVKTIPALTVLFLLFQDPASAQVNKDQPVVKREVTLYNPYKPSMSVIRKMSFLPDMRDTAKVRPEFHYVVSARPFQPEYTISPIKAAALVPDPLPKLYKGFVNLGFGNHVTPLAEISITNERSRKGSFGIYGRHLSTNDDIMLQNAKSVYGGFMDNDASVFGRGLFRKSQLSGSVDFTQRVRYAYGYDPAILDYNPVKKDIRMNYDNIGAKAYYSSTNMDSTDLFYKFGIHFNYFRQTQYLYQQNGGMEGTMAKSYKGYYVGATVNYEHYRNSDSINGNSQFIASVNPFLKKRTSEWNFKLGFRALLDRESILHLYPDVDFGFSIVPSYLSFFASLTGRLERNDPLKVIAENPWLVSDQFPQFVSQGSLFKVPDTDHKFIVTTGLKGNTGGGGSYLVSAIYSKVDNMLFFSNLESDSVTPRAFGNYFLPVVDALDVLNFHAEMNGPVNDKLSYRWMANYYSYSTNMQYAWNKPDWDGQLGLKYNLRDKILAGIEFTAMGKRREIVNGDLLSIQAGYAASVIEMPVHFNINLTAEYRYSKILSFWARFNNITFDRYYEWAYYPSQRFIGMIGFTYSL